MLSLPLLTFQLKIIVDIVVITKPEQCLCFREMFFFCFQCYCCCFLFYGITALAAFFLVYEKKIDSMIRLTSILSFALCASHFVTFFTALCSVSWYFEIYVTVKTVFHHISSRTHRLCLIHKHIN